MLLAGLLLTAAVAAACSDGSDSEPTNTPEPSATSVPSPTAVPTEAPPAVLDWQGCGGGMECATIVLPLDYDDASAGTVSLPLIRRPAADPNARIGSLLVNPGGPGVSGVDFVRAAYLIYSPDVRERFDIVGWDPRGVAASEPAVDCVGDLDAYISLDPSPDSVEEQQTSNAEAEQLAEACAARSGDLLPYLATEYTARDMDRIRAALGDEKLSYFGYSYGTYLGAVYAKLFPTHVRAMVLDGALDPSVTAQQDVKNQVTAFERSLNAFLAYCAANPSCSFYSGGDPAAAYDALMTSLEQTPIAGDGSIDVGSGLAQLGVISLLYYETDWPLLADALAAAQAGDGSALLAASGFITGRIGPESYSNELEQRIAIRCVDDQRLTPEEEQALQEELEVLAPRFGQPGIGPAGDPCDFWPVDSEREPKRITAPGSPPILVVGTTGDPATPYQQAVSLAEQLSSGVLLTMVGEQHTAYGGVNACIDDAVDAYLIDLVPPPDGTTCE